MTITTNANNMTTTKTRNMTAKGFLFKSNSGKVVAQGFLAAHREWLETGDRLDFTLPILIRLDEGELLPTPALEEIKGAVFAHYMMEQAAKAERSLERSSTPKEMKAYVATVCHADGNIATRVTEKGETQDLQKDFSLGQEAGRWLDRRLFEAAPDCHGSIVFNGKDIITTRDMAIERLLKRPIGSVMNRQSKTTNRLGFGVKAKQDVAKFSRG